MNKGGRSSEAVEIVKSVEEKEALYLREMLEARTKGYELIEKEQKKAVTARDKKINEAKEKITETFEANKAELEKRASEARSAIEVEAEKMAEQITTNILRG